MLKDWQYGKRTAKQRMRGLGKPGLFVLRNSSLLLAAAAGSGYGFAVALGLSWWQHGPPLVFGSAGEWVSGLGAFAAAVAAVWLGNREHSRSPTLPLTL